MIRLELTDEEHLALIHIMERELSDLRVEIGDTDSAQYKKVVRSQKEAVARILEKLRETTPGQEEAYEGEEASVELSEA
jgi:hypothetical protein